MSAGSARSDPTRRSDSRGADVHIQPRCDIAEATRRSSLASLLLYPHDPIPRFRIRRITPGIDRGLRVGHQRSGHESTRQRTSSRTRRVASNHATLPLPTVYPDRGSVRFEAEPWRSAKYPSNHGNPYASIRRYSIRCGWSASARSAASGPSRSPRSCPRTTRRGCRPRWPACGWRCGRGTSGRGRSRFHERWWCAGQTVHFASADK